MSELELPLSVILVGLLFMVVMAVIWRTIYIKNWIAYYCKNCLHRALLPKPENIRIDRSPTVRHIEFTWNKAIWHKSELIRSIIISDAALKAFNGYKELFLQDKALLHIDIKAIKKMRFHHSLVTTCFSSPKWGAKISISYIERPLSREEPQKECKVIEDSQITKGISGEFDLTFNRHIIVCKDV